MRMTQIGAAIGGAVQGLVFTLAMTLASRVFRVREAFSGSSASVSGCRLAIRSGTRVLDAVLLEPTLLEPQGQAQAALLICHGIGEVVEQWAGVQALLAEDGIASLVFDYSGYGRSSGCITAAHCEQDARAAFGCLQERFPSLPISLLGFSLGSGVAAAILQEVPAQSLVVCAAFTSFRAAARRIGVRKQLAGLLPPIWDNVAALRACKVPILIVHGKQDTLFPLQMAEELRGACASPVQLIVVEELTHDAPYAQPQRSYWGVIARHLLACGQAGSTGVSMAGLEFSQELGLERAADSLV